MHIPKRIQIAGLDIEIIEPPDLNKDKGMGGHVDYAGQRILVAGDLPPQLREVSYLHEVVHYILFVMGEEALRDNEKFVDIFAHLLHQVLTSGEET